jgi:hypothetical protein
MKVPRSISKLLENKIVLYIVFFLALMMIFKYMMVGNTTAIIMFILVGFLVSRFSKNMIVILLAPIVFTTLFMMGKRVQEGMVSGAPDISGNSTTDGSGNTAVASPPMASPAVASPTVASPAMETAMTPSPTCPSGQSMVDGKCVSGMSTMYKKDNRLDYAATVEDAYADLDKILGGDGIKNLTSDTQRLMEQQTQLANAMKGMAPLLEQAKGMLQGFDLKNLDGLAAMAKNMGSAAGPAAAN